MAARPSALIRNSPVRRFGRRDNIPVKTKSPKFVGLGTETSEDALSVESRFQNLEFSALRLGDLEASWDHCSTRTPRPTDLQSSRPLLIVAAYIAHLPFDSQHSRQRRQLGLFQQLSNFVLIGGLAAMAHGSARATLDVLKKRVKRSDDNHDHAD